MLTESGDNKHAPLLELLSAKELASPIDTIRSLFASSRIFNAIRNPHAEIPVREEIKQKARLSAVLIPIILRGNEPTILITKRQSHIRFGGHLCFPGGIVDPGDSNAVSAALRESKEEVDLDSDQVEVLGTLGDYFTQAGYLIKPIVGLITPPSKIEANTDEVSDIYEIRLSDVLNSKSYHLNWHTSTRGHFAFEHLAHRCIAKEIEADQSSIAFDTKVRVAGPTVSLLIGLYEALLVHSRKG
jgi:8-oxo-dGTP pyrophosphatase MutT (NUDIX family)